MIDKKTATFIVAKTIGIELPKTIETKLQIKNLVANIRGVNIVGKIFKISPINEFQKKNGKSGKVANVFISDGTGYTRIPLWNDHVKMIEEEVFSMGDTIQINNAMTKENIYGETELMIGKFGKIEKIENSENNIPSLENLNNTYISRPTGRIKIENIIPGKFEIKGTIVQIFRGKFIFGEDSDKGLVISSMVDDGTGNLRVVFFREIAEKISGMKPDDIINLSEQDRLDFVKKALLGKEFLISGNIKKNTFFDCLELIAEITNDVNPLNESKILENEIKSKLGVYNE